MRFQSDSVKRQNLYSICITIVCLVSLVCATNLVGQTLPNYSAYGGTAWLNTQLFGNNNPPVVGTEVDSLSCPAPLNQLTYTETGFHVVSAMNSGILPLQTDGQGNWTPATASFTGSPSLGPNGSGSNQIIWTQMAINGAVSKYDLALSSSGIVTIIEAGSTPLKGGVSYYNTFDGKESWIAKEIIDLNTGQDRWQINVTAVGQSRFDGYNCSANASFDGKANIKLNIELTPNPTPPTDIFFVDPAIANGQPTLPLPSTVNSSTLALAPTALALAADGQSAAVVIYQSDSDDKVVLSLSAPDAPGVGSIGTLSAFTPTYLSAPKPGGSTKLPIAAPINPGCGAVDDPCTFVALLWPPDAMPDPPTSSGALSPEPLDLVVEVNQDENSESHSITLQPPPVVLVHGIWSSGNEAWGTFEPWLKANYPDSPIELADYQRFNSLIFSDPHTQDVLADAIEDAFTDSAAQGLVARRVDVIAHSMGGLATRYFMDNGIQDEQDNSLFSKNVVHKLITIGTPTTGTNLAKTLEEQVANPTPVASTAILDSLLCLFLQVKPCTAPNLFTKLDKPIGGAVESLQYGYSSKQPFQAIQGQRPSNSLTLAMLDAIIKGFTGGKTVDTLIGSENDTIVPGASQIAESTEHSLIPNIVHTTLPVNNLVDVGETVSPAVWNQAVYWLMGGEGQYNGPGISTDAEDRSNTAATKAAPPAAFFDLDGYTQIAPTGLSITPATGAALTMGTLNHITAKSTTKTITELLLFQAIADPSDIFNFSSTQSPFQISFVPTRLGATSFAAIAVYSDKTFAMVPLNYTLNPAGNPLSLTVAAPSASLLIGHTFTAPVTALLSNGLFDVTTSATYKVRSGTSKVISLAAGGTLTATGNGIDWLDASYGGLTASAQISVGGACTFALSPTQQLLNYAGGSAKIQVTTQTGCAWTASTLNTSATPATWLTLTPARGTGSGTISATAKANTTEGEQSAILTLGSNHVLLLQPTSACSYAVQSGNISLPATGGTGLISVSADCPVFAKSSATWLVPVPSSQSVYYGAIANPSSSKRTAKLTIGTQALTVTEAPIAPAATPVFTPAPGTYATPQSVSITSTTPGATIHFTTNGVTPTTASTKYTAPITVSTSETLKAIVVAPYYLQSALSTATYSIVPLAATPTFTPAAGTYKTAQSVALKSTTAGSSLYFTTDGSTPTTASTKYTIPIAVKVTETIQAIAIAPKYASSTVASANYTVETPTATPLVYPYSGIYHAAFDVEIIETDPSAIVYYTTNGTTPTSASTKYTGTFPVKASETVKVIAIDPNSLPSVIVTTAYTITPIIATSMTLTSSANPQTAGANITFTVFVKPASGAAIPTGTVTTTIDGNPGPTGSFDATGHASYSTNQLPAGSHAITATYSGDSNYSSSSASMTEVVK